MPRTAAWRKFLQMPGAWAMQGFAMFSVIEKVQRPHGSDRLGPWHPEGWPGTEVGWALRARAWGKGYATEACDRGDRLGVRRPWLDRSDPFASSPKTSPRRRWRERLGSRNRGPGRAAGAVRDAPSRYLGPDARGMARAAREQREARRMITVHGFSPSGNCHKVRLLLEQLGREYRWIEIDSAAGADAHAGIPREESERQGADDRARRRPRAGRIQRDPVLARRRHAATCRPTPGNARRRWRGCSSSSTATSRTSRSRASSAAGRRSTRRAAPSLPQPARTRPPGAGGDGTPSVDATPGSRAAATASPTSRCSRTPTSRGDGGFDLAPYPAIRDWLARVRTTAGLRADAAVRERARARSAESRGLAAGLRDPAFPTADAHESQSHVRSRQTHSRPHEGRQPRRDLRRQTSRSSCATGTAAPIAQPSRGRSDPDGSALRLRAASASCSNRS